MSALTLEEAWTWDDVVTSIKECCVNCLTVLSDCILWLLDLLAQVQPVEKVKKNDDLWPLRGTGKDFGRPATIFEVDVEALLPPQPAFRLPVPQGMLPQQPHSARSRHSAVQHNPLHYLGAGFSSNRPTFNQINRWPPASPRGGFPHPQHPLGVGQSMHSMANGSSFHSLHVPPHPSRAPLGSRLSQQQRQQEAEGIAGGTATDLSHRPFPAFHNPSCHNLSPKDSLASAPLASPFLTPSQGVFSPPRPPAPLPLPTGSSTAEQQAEQVPGAGLGFADPSLDPSYASSGGGHRRQYSFTESAAGPSSPSERLEEGLANAYSWHRVPSQLWQVHSPRQQLPGQSSQSGREADPGGGLPPLRGLPEPRRSALRETAEDWRGRLPEREPPLRAEQAQRSTADTPSPLPAAEGVASPPRVHKREPSGDIETGLRLKRVAPPQDSLQRPSRHRSVSPKCPLDTLEERPARDRPSGLPHDPSAVGTPAQRTAQEAQPLQPALLGGPPRGSSPTQGAPATPDLPSLQAPLEDLPADLEVVEPADVQLGDLIGEGGFGKVYFARWNKWPLDRGVAVKVLSKEATERAALIAEFRREVATMWRLSQEAPHPNVLSLLGACVSPPSIAIITPFCERGSMYAMLHSPTVTLTWRQVCELCLGAARGMAHLHSRNILHRDLKSGNLLVEESWNVRVADFGLARIVAEVTTMTGGVGTWQWMAPEVLAHQRYTEKADVYSFGIVCWETSSRQVPFPGLTGVQAAIAVVDRGLRPDRSANTPPWLWELMSACWDPLPARRPSFEVIVERLQAQLDVYGSR